MQKIAFDDLPSYSDRVKTLLYSPHPLASRSISSTNREYEIETWGRLLSKFSPTETLTCSTVENSLVDPKIPTVIHHLGDTYIATEAESLSLHLKALYDEIFPFIRYSTQLVEIGAGFGSKIFGLVDAYPDHLSAIPLLAYEYTTSGRELISRIGNNYPLFTKAHQFSFFEETFLFPDISEGSVIFTSYAACYSQNRCHSFLNALLARRPRRVIHLEPVIESYQQNTLSGILYAKYLTDNHYSSDLVPSLSRMTSDNLITSTFKPNVISTNPLMPCSLISWSPK